MIEWKTLSAFYLMIPLALVILWSLKFRHSRLPTLRFSSLQVVSKINKGWRTYLMFVPTLIKISAIGVAIVALARPQQADIKIKKNVEGVDIVIALDISASMLIEDMKPDNRMDSAKETIRKFVKGRNADRLALIVFAGESYTRVPLTLDYELILDSIKGIDIMNSIKDGTAIGVALANAVGRLEDSTAKSRVVIFMTDGENNSGTIDPDTALEIAKGYGVKVYSIGIGRDGETRIPVTTKDALGRPIKQYQPFYSKINEDLMEKMASETGGKFYRAISTNALEKIFKDIDRLEKTKIEVNKFTRYSELFPTYLYWAILLYVFAALLRNTVLRRNP